jgi:ribosomal protein L11 methyltransferase
MGAATVLATDIDPWSYENARENLALNQVTNLEVLLGDASVLPPDRSFDLILANINRNALLQELPAYQRQLKPGGRVIISGFYAADVAAFEPLARQWGWKVARQLQENQWVALAWQAP